MIGRDNSPAAAIFRLDPDLELLALLECHVPDFLCEENSKIKTKKKVLNLHKEEM